MSLARRRGPLLQSHLADMSFCALTFRKIAKQKLQQQFELLDPLLLITHTRDAQELHRRHQRDPNDDSIRHPLFQGLREDKQANEVMREIANAFTITRR